VEIEDNGRVERFVEKPPAGTMTSNLINAGSYVFEPSVVERIPPGRPASLEREIFPDLVERAGLYALATDDYWIDAGRPELYLRANLDLVNGRRSERVEPVAPGADVHPSAAIFLSLIGSGAVVAEGASVTGSVVLPGATVGLGATVERSIIMGRVGPGAAVCDSVIGADGDVPEGTTVVDARIPTPA
jgi:mannose-1-phosphate guanylyltransferase